jgi:hypothetical protein
MLCTFFIEKGNIFGLCSRTQLNFYNILSTQADIYAVYLVLLKLWCKKKTVRDSYTFYIPLQKTSYTHIFFCINSNTEPSFFFLAKMYTRLHV